MNSRKIIIGGAEFEVRQATVLDGIKRGRLINQAPKTDDPDRYIFDVMVYPCLASVTSGDWTPEMVLAIPGDIVDAWLSVVYELNPHFLSVGTPEDIQKKVIPLPSE